MVDPILRYAWRCLCLFLLIPSLHGCGLMLAGGAAAGTVAYVRGELNAMLDAPLGASVQAVDAAVKKTGIVQISRQTDSFGAQYSLRTAKEEKVEISLERATSSATAIVIRVGLFGDEKLSYQILNEIKRHLKRSNARMDVGPPTHSQTRTIDRGPRNEAV